MNIVSHRSLLSVAIADAMKKHRAINAPVLLWHEFFLRCSLLIISFCFFIQILPSLYSVHRLFMIIMLVTLRLLLSPYLLQKLSVSTLVRRYPCRCGVTDNAAHMV